MADEFAKAPELIEDVSCRRCGYNLRTLRTDAVCPECGTRVADSLRGNSLRDADPEWVEELSFGAGLKLWNIALGIVGGFAAGLLVAAGLPPGLIVLATLIGGALGLWATFLITTQEPRISLQEDPLTLRKALRACAVVSFAGGVLGQAGVMAVSVTLQIASAILGLAGMFVMWGELLYFRRFADRVPDEKLRRSTTMLMWIAPITGGMGLILGAVMAITYGVTMGTPGGGGPVVVAAAPSAGPRAAAVVPICFFSAFGLYLFLWYVRVLTRYRKVFKEAATLARATIATAGVTGLASDQPRDASE